MDGRVKPGHGDEALGMTLKRKVPPFGGTFLRARPFGLRPLSLESGQR
jgi:hypothetical protein